MNKNTGSISKNIKKYIEKNKKKINKNNKKNTNANNKKNTNVNIKKNTNVNIKKNNSKIINNNSINKKITLDKLVINEKNYLNIKKNLFRYECKYIEINLNNYKDINEILAMIYNDINLYNIIITLDLTNVNIKFIDNHYNSLIWNILDNIIISSDLLNYIEKKYIDLYNYLIKYVNGKNYEKSCIYNRYRDTTNYKVIHDKIITIIIPTKNRHHILDSCIEYYKKLDCEIIIVDTTRNIYNGNISDIKYFHLPDGNYRNQIKTAIENTNNTIITLAPDDDRLLYNSIIDSYIFLNENIDYSTIYGKFLTNNDRGITVRHKDRLDRILKKENKLNKDIITNINIFFDSFYFVPMGATYRKKVLENFLEFSIDINFNNEMFWYEFLFAITVLYTGKVHIMYNIFGIRERGINYDCDNICEFTYHNFKIYKLIEKNMNKNNNIIKNYFNICYDAYINFIKKFWANRFINFMDNTKINRFDNILIHRNYIKESYSSSQYFANKNNIIEILNGYLSDSPNINLHNLLEKNKDKKCIIIGNGPSLSNIRLDLLKNYITIACNSFIYGLYENKLNFIPTIICSGDGFSTKYIYTDYFNLLYDEDKDMQPILITHPTFSLNPSLNKIEINNSIKNLKKYNNNYLIKNFDKFKLTKNMIDNNILKNNIKNYCYKYGNIIPMISMLIAEKLGFKNIYLIGVDLEDVDDHFYEKDKNLGDLKNFANNKKLRTDNLKMGYKNRYDEYLSKDINIYINYTTQGLDYIPRFNIEDLYEK